MHRTVWVLIATFLLVAYVAVALSVMPRSPAIADRRGQATPDVVATSVAANAARLLGDNDVTDDVVDHRAPDYAPPEFLSFNGVVFDPTYPDSRHALGERHLGPQVGRVEFRPDATDAAFPCAADLPDGAATYLDLGTPIFAVRGYATYARIAIRQGSEIMLYEPWCNPRARVGADLYDVAGRVERITVHPSLDGGPGDHRRVLAHIDDRATIAALVDDVLAAPVVAGEIASTYRLTLELADGTAVILAVSPAGVWRDQHHLPLPHTFAETIERAVRERRPGRSTPPARAAVNLQ